MNDVVLVYIYKVRSEAKRLPPLAELRPTNLLLPPLMINRLPWSRGYFETIGNLPLGDEDALPRHTFRRFTGQYFDEYNNQLSQPNEPVGEYGLQSYLTIDDAISDALGYPRIPEKRRRRTSS